MRVLELPSLAAWAASIRWQAWRRAWRSGARHAGVGECRGPAGARGRPHGAPARRQGRAPTRDRARSLTPLRALAPRHPCVWPHSKWDGLKIEDTGEGGSDAPKQQLDADGGASVSAGQPVSAAGSAWNMNSWHYEEKNWSKWGKERLNALIDKAEVRRVVDGARSVRQACLAAF